MEIPVIKNKIEVLSSLEPTEFYVWTHTLEFTCDLLIASTIEQVDEIINQKVNSIKKNAINKYGILLYLQKKEWIYVLNPSRIGLILIFNTFIPLEEEPPKMEIYI